MSEDVQKPANSVHLHIIDDADYAEVNQLEFRSSQERLPIIVNLFEVLLHRVKQVFQQLLHTRLSHMVSLATFYHLILQLQTTFDPRLE